MNLGKLATSETDRLAKQMLASAGKIMVSFQNKRGLIKRRTLCLGLSFLSLVICAVSAAAHYLKWAWGNPWQPISWLVGMLLLLLAFVPQPREIGAGLMSLVKPKAAFFLFWILLFTLSRIWHFSTAPWNGNALFDESGWDLWFLKSHVIGHPFQPAWFHFPISRETLFHYYVWGFLRLLGYNIISYEVALFVIWCATFLFTLLLIDVLFESTIVTGFAAIIFVFLPYSFIYTFAGYRYPMGTALCVASLYFLHLGFRRASSFHLSLGGILAGLCLASSISGKQYVLALVLCGLLYAGLHWKTVVQSINWKAVSIVTYGFVVAAAPIICYIAFNEQQYTLYEASFLRDFWHAVRVNRPPNDITHYTRPLWNCFFSVPGHRFFIPDVLPIPLPYYFFLVPGLVLAVGQRRYEIVLLATIPVVGAFVAVSIDNRLLLAIPFWIVLMAFSFAGLLRLKVHPAFKILLWAASVVIMMRGLLPSIQYINSKTKNPFGIYYYAQEEVAVSRFLRNVVAGNKPSDPPRLEYDEFNRINGIPEATYDTLICPGQAYSIIHLFLHDYDDAKILSFCGGSPVYVMTLQAVWSANKKAIADYVPSGKDLKLIWESDPRTERIIKLLQPLRDLATEESLTFSFARRRRVFHVLNIPSNNIRPFQERIRVLPNSIR
jgi:hypothetical protein